MLFVRASFDIDAMAFTQKSRGRGIRGALLVAMCLCSLWILCLVMVVMCPRFSSFLHESFQHMFVCILAFHGFSITREKGEGERERERDGGRETRGERERESFCATPVPNTLRIACAFLHMSGLDFLAQVFSL